MPEECEHRWRLVVPWGPPPYWLCRCDICHEEVTAKVVLEPGSIITCRIKWEDEDA